MSLLLDTSACVISLVGMVYCLITAAIEGQGLTPEGSKSRKLSELSHELHTV